VRVLGAFTGVTAAPGETAEVTGGWPPGSSP